MMDFFIELYEFIAVTTEAPLGYSAYHFMWIGITLLLTVLLLVVCKNLNDTGVRRMACILWITLSVLELIKQLIYGFYVDNGRLVWDYAWYSFPFQFCASPLYVLPIIAFAKDGKLHDAAITFMATFALFAGICVCIYPNDVLCSHIFINAQGMFHHGAQVFFGIYLAFRYRHKMSFKNLARATLIFSILAGIAMILNIAVYHIFSAHGIDDTFNMFFISPYFDCTLPVLSTIYDITPYPVFLCIYILGFMLCAGIVMLLMKGLIKITHYDKYQ